ncbi:hypothetical protein E6C67_11140 [Azospirillum sp. TSA2s]|uniref:hypothetical protein n=1 Tax=Azospirillum sp. TSA2s TaxID=709810 RepID=UPI0010AB49D2|nr:hypothetical protein [Azospirillum sp. TSA2s]QCG94474.1 hypothetical protein E6C67_11140 [Azospirillum sp. TSA2s]
MKYISTKLNLVSDFAGLLTKLYTGLIASYVALAISAAPYVYASDIVQICGARYLMVEASVPIIISLLAIIVLFLVVRADATLSSVVTTSDHVSSRNLPFATNRWDNAARIKMFACLALFVLYAFMVWEGWKLMVTLHEVDPGSVFCKANVSDVRRAALASK